MAVQAHLFKENLYLLDDGRVRQFLFVGEGEALLIDAGFDDGKVYEAVRGITDAPIKVIMTHGDGDHAGGLGEFGECWLHEKDWNLINGSVNLHPLKEGDVFECAGYRLEAIEIPGHTYGSVAFADWNRKMLFPGDSVQKPGPIFLFGAHRNLDLYIESQRKLCGFADRITVVLPCHNECPIDAGYIEKNLKDAEALRAGSLRGEKHPVMPCSLYRGTWTEFYYDK